MKVFKSKKIKKRKNKIYLFLIILLISYVYIINISKSNALDNTILTDNIEYIDMDMKKLVTSFLNKKISNPVIFLDDNIRKENYINVNKKEESILKTYNNNETKKYEPIVYIYNTHQTEKYEDYSVYEASKYLYEKLNNQNIQTYFEMQSVSAFLSNNNMKYSKSYDVSKNYMLSAKQSYPSLKYFIDIHRDSSNKNKVTLTYKNTKYAKVLFIVGLDNANYKANLKNTEYLNSLFESIVPGISRGIYKKQGKGVNGIYNQDVSDNVFLIEVGSLYSTKEEVLNTINVIENVIIRYLGGKV